MRRKDKVRIFKICLIVFFVILLLAIVGLLLYGLVFKKEDEEVQYTAGEDEVITWNGASYVYNDHLSNYLFIGIDEYEFEEGEDGEAKAAASDALYLLSYNRMTGDMEIVSIPRDTMTDIEVILQDGTSGGFSRDHISLSYSFGDGKHESCKLTKEAVSKLLYGLPITGYCTMSMSGLAAIPEIIGSFEVVVPNDSLAAEQKGYEEGATVTITPENSEFFVRTRDIEMDHSAIYRQERQVAYLEGVYHKAGELFDENPEIMVDLYDAMQPYIITNMTTDIFVELAEKVYTGNELNTWTIPGESVVGKQFDEYHIDDNALYEQVMASFYKRIDG